MRDKIGHHLLEPIWRPSRQLCRGRLPAVWRSWLLDDGSLTQRLQQHCHGQFQVEVMSQKLERPMRSEARALGRPGTELAWVRQVRLCCDGGAWVFARTVIPLPSLRLGLGRLTQLGSRPLGAVLFADPKIHRGPIEVAAIRSHHRLHAMAQVPNQHTLWGRRSVFVLHACPLLVSEFFMPALLIP